MEVSGKREFNYGIEVLRIISMLMVVVLHVLGQGGILGSAEYLSLQYHVAWLLEIICYCAVNCYALISGYVMIESNFKYKKYLLMWLQVFAYSIGITLLFMMCNSQSINLKFVIESFLPVLSRRWWYFTAYTGVFFLVPFLNIMIKGLDKKKMLLLCTTLFVLFSVLPTAVSRFWGDLFYTQSGYSMLWLMILYILGAAYKRYENDLADKYKSILKIAIIGWIVCVFITFIFHNLGMYLPDGFPGKHTIVNNFVNYTSPTMVGGACCMLVVFARLKISSSKLKRCVNSISRLSFGVYLIHVHPLVWQWLNRRFVSLAVMPVWKMFWGITISSLVIFMLCICVDAVRNKLFQLLKLRERLG